MKDLIVCVFVAFFAASVIVEAADKGVTVGDITAKVLGQSGKIKIYKDNTSDPNMITINFDYIKELDSAMEAMTGSHSYNNFAQLDFAFSSLTNTTFANSDVAVTQFDFTATIEPETNKVATLVAYVYMFTEDGNITVNGEDIEVNSGDVKFNVKITDWPFCGQGDVTCTKGQTTIMGEYLDFAIEIKGSGTAQKNTGGSGTGPDSYDLGGGAKVLVPKKVIYDDGTAIDMPTGYPALVTSGSKSVFVFRFAKFASSVLYDPVVSTGSAEEPEPEKNIVQTGISTKVKGKSGKIEMMSTAAGDSGNKIVVEFDDLAEKMADGTAINDNDHRFNGFANQDFTFGSLVEEQYHGIAVHKLPFSATLTNGATINVDMYVFKADGTVTNDDETIDVKEGNVKFNFGIENWVFCTACSQSGATVVGGLLDFAIVIKGKGGSAVKGTSGAKKGEKYDLGGGSVTLSAKTKVDGNFTNMATGYPKTEMKGSKQVFMFRFNKFTTGVLYDPVMALDGAGANLRASVMAIVTCALICLWKWF